MPGPPIATAKSLIIDVTRPGTNTVLALNGQPCSPEHLSVILDKLSSYSTNLQVNVHADAAATASDLAQMLYLVQQAGLHNVVLVAPGVRDGQAGYYRLSVDCAKRPIGGCIADFFVDSGFHPADGPYYIELGDIRNEIPDQRNAHDSQPSPGAYSGKAADGLAENAQE